MTNLHFTKQIENHKNELLNFISSDSKTFRFNFLSNYTSKSSKCKAPMRKDMSGCHCCYTPFTADTNAWVTYGESKAYYISFNEWVDGESTKMTIRSDYMLYLSGESLSNKYFLFFSKSKDKIYEIPFAAALNEFIKLGNKSIIRNGAYPCVHFDVEKLATKSVEQNHNEYVQECTNSFNPDYFEPRFIGNFAYSKYRNTTKVNIFKISTSGEILAKKTFRSIKECYDALSAVGVEELKTYKTFQRHCAAGDFTYEYTLKTGQREMIIVSLNDEVYPEVTEVIDETIPNVMFCEDLPEDEQNPRNVIVKSHYEVAVKQRKINVEDIKEREIICFPDYDDNESTNDELQALTETSKYCSADVENKVDVPLLPFKYVDNYGAEHFVDYPDNKCRRFSDTTLSWDVYKDYRKYFNKQTNK